MRIILISVLFFIYILPTYSQLNWAPVGATWYYHSIESRGPLSIGYLIIESIGDTVVDDITMSILQFTRYNTSGTIDIESTELTYEIDSIIYIWKNNNPNILYDFTKSVGESQTVIGYGINVCGEDSIGSIIIDSIGDETFNGFESSYFYSSPSDSSLWDLRWKTNSRYGNQQFLFASPAECGIADMPFYAGPLRCYYDNEIGWINTLGVQCDTFIILDSNVSLASSDFQLYPNPSLDYLIIKSNLNIEGNTFIYRVISSDGRELIVGSIDGFLTHISLDIIPPGIFYIQIKEVSTSNDMIFKMLKIKK